MAVTSLPPNDPAVALFAKYPRLGQVKTRLEGPLTPEGCLRLYRAFLLDTLERIASLDAACFLFLADCSARERTRFSARPEVGLEVEPQRGNDLGERMADAYRRLAARFRSVVFLGTDSPDLPLRLVRQAFAALERKSVVVGPSGDGGYYLLGLSKSRPEIFTGIDWGTESVLRQTLDRLSQGEYELLPEWYDVDVEVDLRRLVASLASRSPGPEFPSRTAAALEALRAEGFPLGGSGVRG